MVLCLEVNSLSTTDGECRHGPYAWRLTLYQLLTVNVVMVLCLRLTLYQPLTVNVVMVLYAWRLTLYQLLTVNVVMVLCLRLTLYQPLTVNVVTVSTRIYMGGLTLTLHTL